MFLPNKYNEICKITKLFWKVFHDIYKKEFKSHKNLTKIKIYATKLYKRYLKVYMHNRLIIVTFFNLI